MGSDWWISIVVCSACPKMLRDGCEKIAAIHVTLKAAIIKCEIIPKIILIKLSVDLVPRVSLSLLPGAREGGRGERDPGNEVDYLYFK